MPVTTTLTGGAWQDPHGNLVANGTLVLQLSQDAVVTTGGQVAPLEVTFTLDANANLPGGATVYANDSLSPSGTFYTAEVLNSGGSRVWGPEKWTLVNGTTDAGTIVPTTSGAGVTTSVPTIQHNGTNNTSQTVANFTDTSSITWANPSGGVLQATFAGTSGASFTTAGQGFLSSGDSILPFTGGSAANIAYATDATANKIQCYQLILPYTITVRKLVTRVDTGSGAGTFYCFAMYNAAANSKLLDAGTNAFNTQTSSTVVVVTLGTPVTFTPGMYWCAGGGTANSSGQGTGCSITNTVLPSLNGSTAIWGTSNQTIASGVMPSTLGTITAYGATAQTTPLILLEV